MGSYRLYPLDAEGCVNRDDGIEASDEAACFREVIALRGGGEAEIWSGDECVGWISASYADYSVGHPIVTWYCR